MLLVSGSLAYDTIMDFPGTFTDHILPEKLHTLNVSFLVPKMHKSYGGTAGNISYTLALLGVRPTIVGRVGSDFGPYEEFLQAKGVDTSQIGHDTDCYTATAVGITDSADNQIWGFYPGADEKSETLSVKKIISSVKTQSSPSAQSHFAIIAPHNPSAMMKFSREYTELGIPYLFDPGMQLRWLSGENLKEAFGGAKIIIGNDYEIAMMEKMTGVKDLHQQADDQKIIITTLGEKGSHITQGKQIYDIPVVPVSSAEDPSGAGDAYRAGFVAGYLKQLPLEVCGRLGALAASYAVESYGTVDHQFTKEEFETRYKENFKDSINL